MHIFIDYRIACSMLNFLHKPCCPDGQKVIEISQRMKKRAEIQECKLEFLLKKRLNTSFFSKTDLNKIDDFPHFNQTELKEKIFFSSFKLRQCKSYLYDLIRNNQAYLITTKYAKITPDLEIRRNILAKKTKIVSVVINSRHKRSLAKNKSKSVMAKKKEKFKTNYKVFLEYEPGNFSTKSIKSIPYFHFIKFIFQD